MKEYKYKINGNTYKVTIGDIDENIAHVEVNGTPYKVEMEKAPKVVVKPVVRPTTPAPAPTPVVKPAAPSTGKSGVKSPLPGVILDIKVNVGDTVKRGQTIIILEAMKMEYGYSTNSPPYSFRIETTSSRMGFCTPDFQSSPCTT